MKAFISIAAALALTACSKPVEPVAQFVTVTTKPQAPLLAADCQTDGDPVLPAKQPRPDKPDGSLSEAGTVRDRNQHREIIQTLKGKRAACAASISAAFPPDLPQVASAATK